MSFEVRAEIAIDAPIAVVWDVITDVVRWHEWSTWLRHEGGAVALGSKLELRLTPPSGGGYAFSPEVIALEAPAEVGEARFGWVGRTGVRGVFDGEHHFVLRAEGERTRLLHYERYSGLLSPLLAKLPAMRDAPAGFEAMNAEVKARAESLVRPRA